MWNTVLHAKIASNCEMPNKKGAGLTPLPSPRIGKNPRLTLARLERGHNEKPLWT